jgi:3-methyladenine DNA glycosylase AlkD
MNSIEKIRLELCQKISMNEKDASRFFNLNTYSKEDKFLGIKVPDVRSIAKKYINISFEDIEKILKSKFNEERLLGLLILVEKFKSKELKEKVFNIYIKNLDRVNNWNLVDLSAYKIIGEYTMKGNKDILIKLSYSNNLWHRRIAIVSTLYYIKNNILDYTYKIAKILINDPEDIINKAVGWLLRESGKVDVLRLKKFLKDNIENINKTTLRYSIERMSDLDRSEIKKRN